MWTSLSFRINMASLSYVIPEICCIASSTRFLFQSASHNVRLCLLDDMPNNSNGRGCHGSDAPHLSLVTGERGVGTKLWESLFSEGGNICCTLASFVFCRKIFPNKDVKPDYKSSIWLFFFLRFLLCFCFSLSPSPHVFSFITFSLLPSFIPRCNQIDMNTFRLTE